MALVDGNVFSKILERGYEKGIIPAKTDAARSWYRESGMRARSTRALIKEMMKVNRGRDDASIGRMYFFSYDPKYKKELPYYDRIPLIFPIEPRGRSGFLGINFHYLPLPYRAKLMDALYSISNNKKFDPSTKLKVSYSILKAYSKYRYFKPCVKSYLYKQVRSPFIEVYAAEWDIALFLPLARFEKATSGKVWSDSISSM